MNDSDLKQFKQLYGRRHNRELASYFGIPLSEVEDLARHYALGKDKATFADVQMPHWTDKDEARLRVIYSDTSNLEIARQLGRTRQSIANKAKRMGLLKSAAHRRQIAQDNSNMSGLVKRHHQKQEEES